MLNYTFSVENGEFSYLRSLKKKKKKLKSRPKFLGILRSVAEGKQTYFFWPYTAHIFLAQELEL